MAKNCTLQDFISTTYKPWVEMHQKSGIETINRIKKCFFGQFSDCFLKNISQLDVDKWRTQRIKSGRKCSTINRDITTLKAALSKAVEWGIIESNPLSNIKPYKIDSSGVVRFLCDEEESRLREALDSREKRMRNGRQSANNWRSERGYSLLPDNGPSAYADYLKPMVLISINTGLRRGELLSLAWEQVDLLKRHLTVKSDHSKSGKTRHIPLNQESYTVFIKWKKQKKADGLVFTNKLGEKLGDIKKSWKSLLKQASIDSFRWHDLRHHFASKLVMAGADLNTVRELLGHSNIEMTLRYAHLAPEHKAQIVALLDKM